MEASFIYYNNLTFHYEEKFSIDNSDEDSFKGVEFKKNKNYYITNMAC